MRNDLTDITVVMDRSGSMAACQKEAESGLNAFIQKQKELPGSALFTLVQFDDKYEFLYKGTPIQNVLACALVPRGSTALLDAVGRAIVETGERLKAMAEHERPGLVVFVILTDGQENSSWEFTKAKVKEMIEHQRDAYKWQFTFLGANQDAFAEAGAIGIPQSAACNFAPDAAERAYKTAGGLVGRMRHAVSAGFVPNAAYTDEERKVASGK